MIRRPRLPAALCVFSFWLTLAPGVCVGPAAAQDYSFDTSGLAKKPFEFAASVEPWATLIVFNKSSPLYSLKYGKETPAFADVYRVKVEAGAWYQYRSILFSASGTFIPAYDRVDDTLTSDQKLYECYFKYAPKVSLSVLAGKKTFRWGKGYAYNPVSFAGRPRDLNDVDAAIEGYWNLSAEYIRGLSGRLSTVAITGALLPVTGSVNEGLLQSETLAGVTQLYLLFYDTDVDVNLFADTRGGSKAGADFSKNLLPNWEIHGEWAFVPNYHSTSFASDSTLVGGTKNAVNLVLGTRYLDRFNTTYIVEYLHQGSGFTSDQMSTYYRVLASAQAFENGAVAQTTLLNSTKLYNRQFIMTDYVYFRASHPDPFMLVYFTPAAYALVNLVDGSAMMGVEMTYTRLSHLLLTARGVAYAGPHDTEFGVKQARGRIELRGKWSF